MVEVEVIQTSTHDASADSTTNENNQLARTADHLTSHRLHEAPNGNEAEHPPSGSATSLTAITLPPFLAPNNTDPPMPTHERLPPETPIEQPEIRR
ncbi:hypothetical protein ADUPG1_003998, partial [Aduncisulcus paluster]